MDLRRNEEMFSLLNVILIVLPSSVISDKQTFPEDVVFLDFLSLSSRTSSSWSLLTFGFSVTFKKKYIQNLFFRMKYVLLFCQSAIEFWKEADPDRSLNLNLFKKKMFHLKTKCFCFAGKHFVTFVLKDQVLLPKCVFVPKTGAKFSFKDFKGTNLQKQEAE